MARKGRRYTGVTTVTIQLSPSESFIVLLFFGISRKMIRSLESRVLLRMKREIYIFKSPIHILKAMLGQLFVSKLYSEGT